jgi:hypothetical protein
MADSPAATPAAPPSSAPPSNVVDFTRFQQLRALGERAVPAPQDALVQADAGSRHRIQVPHRPFYKKVGFWVAAGTVLASYFVFFGDTKEDTTPLPFDPEAVSGEDFFTNFRAPQKRKRRRAKALPAAVAAPPPEPAPAPAPRPQKRKPKAKAKGMLAKAKTKGASPKRSHKRAPRAADEAV